MICLKVFLLFGLVLGYSPGSSHGQLDRSGALMLDKFLAMLNNVTPSTSLGERLEFKELALKDHVNDDSSDSSTQEIIEEAGFRSVTHLVTSQDGYITELINIVNPLAEPSQLKKPPVVMFHGALIDSSCFVWASIRQHHPEKYPRSLLEDGPITSSNRSLAFMLANNGYDVWLASTRASNRQNMNHVDHRTRILEDMLPELWGKANEKHARLMMSTLKYLDYTQDALVEFEYPKQIDEVLRLTRSKQVSVVTYSKSSQVMFKLLASDPVHANRIHSHITLGPVLNLIGSSNLWKMMIRMGATVPSSVGNLLFTQIFGASWTRRLLGLLPRYSWGWYMTTVVGGPSPLYQSFLELPVLGHAFMPISFTELKQYLQQVNAGKLQKFDYGPITNRLVYNGSSTPPEYDISNIKLKHWMMVSADFDVLGTPNSARKYYDLHQHKPYKWIQLRKANHLDLTASFENDVLVNLPILKFMERFQAPKTRVSSSPSL